MKKTASFCLILALVLTACACGSREKTDTKTFFLMDTFLSITLYGEADASLYSEVNSIVSAIEAKASRTLTTSEVYAFNHADDGYTFSDEMAMLIERALAMSEATGGAYDITVAPLVELWNIKEATQPVREEAVAEALTKVGYQQLTLSGNTLTKIDPDVTLDLGSLAKGYALEKAKHYLEEQNAVGILNFGGNVALVGAKSDGSPWRVSLRDPFSADRTKGQLSLTAGVVSVSGDYERYFEADGVRYHHIISPFDGYPVQGVHSVAVCSSDALEADMLSTALFVMGQASAAAFYESGMYEFEYIMTLSQDETIVSEGLDGVYTE